MPRWTERNLRQRELLSRMTPTDDPEVHLFRDFLSQVEVLLPGFHLLLDVAWDTGAWGCQRGDLVVGNAVGDALVIEIKKLPPPAPTGSKRNQRVKANHAERQAGITTPAWATKHPGARSVRGGTALLYPDGRWELTLLH